MALLLEGAENLAENSRVNYVKFSHHETCSTRGAKKLKLAPSVTKMLYESHASCR